MYVRKPKALTKLAAQRNALLSVLGDQESPRCLP